MGSTMTAPYFRIMNYWLNQMKPFAIEADISDCGSLLVVTLYECKHTTYTHQVIL